jgi:hypothetical protein
MVIRKAFEGIQVVPALSVASITNCDHNLHGGDPNTEFFNSHA